MGLRWTAVRIGDDARWRGTRGRRRKRCDLSSCLQGEALAMSSSPAIVAALLIAAGSAIAQTPLDRSTPGVLAAQQVGDEISSATIVVTSSNAAPNGPLPLLYSDYG